MRTRSRRRSATPRFHLDERAPKYLGYFERVIAEERRTLLLGRKLSYVDLSLFQLVEGLRYAFPKAMPAIERKVPRVVAVHDRVHRAPGIEPYLAPQRRIPFNEIGIFRHYPELEKFGEPRC